MATVNDLLGTDKLREAYPKINANTNALNADTGTLKTRIDNIVASAGTSNTEIVDARGTYPVLKDRLDASDNSITSLAGTGRTTETVKHVGLVGNLATTAKTDLVSAVNEVKNKQGDLTTLSTTDKSNIVNAVNEVKTKQGDLTTLATTDKSNIVNAVNEVKNKQGDLTTLSTTNKSTIVGAVNELKNGWTCGTVGTTYWRKDPFGNIEQWGRNLIPTSGGTGQNINFPMVFPSAIDSVVVTPDNWANSCTITSKGTANFSVLVVGDGSSIYVEWMARGR